MRYAVMTKKTKAESIFEEFCALNSIACEKIPEGEQPSPDYRVVFGDQDILVEIKQIDDDDDFSNVSSSRIVGSHIREKIKQARKQAKVALSLNTPFILLVYNNIDGLQMFGTEQHDFVDAMYGERTLIFDTTENAITDSFQGRNSSLRHDKNESFSAIGHLKETQKGTTVKVFENIYAENPLNFSKIPDCIEATRIVVENNNA